jgi:hypothetical protein
LAVPPNGQEPVGAHNGHICPTDGGKAGVDMDSTNNAGTDVRWRGDRRESGAKGDMGEQVANGIGNCWYWYGEKAGGGGEQLISQRVTTQNVRSGAVNQSGTPVVRIVLWWRMSIRK